MLGLGLDLRVAPLSSSPLSWLSAPPAALIAAQFAISISVQPSREANGLLIPLMSIDFSVVGVVLISDALP